jgi:hypothetical protein
LHTPSDDQITVLNQLRISVAQSPSLPYGGGMPEIPVRFSHVAPDPAILSEVGNGEWIRVEGGHLEAPIHLKLMRSMDGRFVVGGLLVDGDASPNGITTAALRQVRIAAILRQLFGTFSLDAAPGLDDAAVIASMINSQSSTRKLVAAPNTPASGRTALTDFARVYSEERIRDSHRAMTAAAGRMKISRATAIRWAHACRAQGLL